MAEEETGCIDGEDDASGQGEYKYGIHLLTAVPSLWEDRLHGRGEHHAGVGRDDHQGDKVTEQIQVRMFPVCTLELAFHLFHG